MKRMPEGVTIVDFPLPYAAMDGYVDERYLAEEIGLAWKGRQLYEAAILDQIGTLKEVSPSRETGSGLADRLLFERSVKSEQAHVRSLERSLGEMLFTMKAIMSQAGREGEWDEFLKTCGIPLATAKPLVARCRRRLRRKRSQKCAW